MMTYNPRTNNTTPVQMNAPTDAPAFRIMDTREIQETFRVSLTDKKLSVCLPLDLSGSMKGKPIEELRRAVTEFLAYLEEDPDVASRTDVCIIGFSDTPEVLIDWTPANKLTWDPSCLKADGLTNLDDAMVKVDEKIQEKVAEYIERGTPYGSPFILLISDGVSTQSIQRSVSLIQRRREEANLLGQKALKLMAAYVSNETDEIKRQQAEKTLASYTGLAISTNGSYREVFDAAFRTIRDLARNDSKEVQIPVSNKVKIVTLN
ncbi:MAG: VWA domain-containing protein [Candidatus Methanomethylophilaceae archaeon]|nr:VWA domain-containing protein [Candidatus Methanomethylophilaceae archaeon]